MCLCSWCLGAACNQWLHPQGVGQGAGTGLGGHAQQRRIISCKLEPSHQSNTVAVLCMLNRRNSLEGQGTTTTDRLSICKVRAGSSLGWLPLLVLLGTGRCAMCGRCMSRVMVQFVHVCFIDTKPPSPQARALLLLLEHPTHMSQPSSPQQCTFLSWAVHIANTIAALVPAPGSLWLSPCPPGWLHNDSE